MVVGHALGQAVPPANSHRRRTPPPHPQQLWTWMVRLLKMAMTAVGSAVWRPWGAAKQQ